MASAKNDGKLVSFSEHTRCAGWQAGGFVVCTGAPRWASGVGTLFSFLVVIFIMKNIFMTLNNVQTHLITWGNPFDCEKSDVIICIAGNPGIPDFYTLFASKLHEYTRLPVCVVGQAGHEVVPDKKSNMLEGQEHLFDLEGQIQHKLDLITRFVEEGNCIHLIGHSIGSWLILEMLAKNINIYERVSSINLLFPTVQRMAQSKSGVFLNNVIRKVHSWLMILCLLLFIIPRPIKGFFVFLYLTFNGLPLDFFTSIMKFLNPSVIEKVLLLAYDEMDDVKELNVNIMEKIKEKTNVLYSPRDGWVPLHYMEDMIRFKPEMCVNEVDAEHAFVLKSSDKIAYLVSDFVNLISSFQRSFGILQRDADRYLELI